VSGASASAPKMNSACASSTVPLACPAWQAEHPRWPASAAPILRLSQSRSKTAPPPDASIPRLRSPQSQTYAKPSNRCYPSSRPLHRGCKH
jgi:hypothetical protein